MSQPERRGGYSVVRHDSTPAKQAEDAADARAFGHTVRLQYGPFKIGVPAVLIGAAGSWLVSRYALPAPASDCPSKGDLNALDVRLGRQSEDIRALTATVNANADREQNHFAIINGALISIRSK